MSVLTKPISQSRCWLLLSTPSSTAQQQAAFKVEIVKKKKPADLRFSGFSDAK
jgi:hypothetical protein